jgi:hypothetical protein
VGPIIRFEGGRTRMPTGKAKLSLSPGEQSFVTSVLDNDSSMFLRNLVSIYKITWCHNLDHHCGQAQYVKNVWRVGKDLIGDIGKLFEGTVL